jgi:hypothetical protein
MSCKQPHCGPICRRLDDLESRLRDIDTVSARVRDLEEKEAHWRKCTKGDCWCEKPKAKEPEKCCPHDKMDHYAKTETRSGCSKCGCSKSLWDFYPDYPPKPSGWRARETEFLDSTVGDYVKAVATDPRAVRVRMHYMNECWVGPCRYPNDCKLEHAEFLQISSEPAVKGGSNG